MTKYKTQNITQIKYIEIKISSAGKQRYWAKIDTSLKRIAEKYFFELKSSGITLISTVNNRKKKIRCACLTKKGLQCSRFALFDTKYCFQHKRKLSSNTSVDNKGLILKKSNFGNFFEKPPKCFLKWVGGKQNLLPTIHSKFPKEINNYHELFLGGGSVLLHVLHLWWTNQIIIKGSIYAYDLNKDLINVYKVIQTNCDLLYNYLSAYSLQYYMKSTLIDKKEYYLLIREKYNETTLHPVEQAAIFIFLNKTCFRGLYRKSSKGFNVPFGHYLNPKIILDKKYLMFLSFFLKDVIFESKGFEASFTKIKERDFVYLDPPYAPEKKSSFVNYTAEGFSMQQHKSLFLLTKKVAQKNALFLMSNADTHFVRLSFNGFYIEEILAKRRINSKMPNSKKKELLINNYKLTQKKSSCLHKVKRFFSTRRQGSSFEKEVSFEKYYATCTLRKESHIHYTVVTFKGCKLKFIHLSKKKFRKYMELKGFIETTQLIAHGCKEPDDVYISGTTLFILEKKYQSQQGSVAEKLQTASFKQNHYAELFPKHKVILIYCLSSWFKLNCPVELLWLKKQNIPVFYCTSNTSLEPIISFMISGARCKKS